MTAISRPATQKAWSSAEAVIRARRSVRAYGPDPVQQTDLLAILEAGRWAPSPHNSEPWRFAVLCEATSKERLARAMGERWRQDLTRDGVSSDAINRALQRSLLRITNPPVVVVVCLCRDGLDEYPDQTRQQAELLMAAHSIGSAIQNMMLVARERGLASGWMCAPLFCPDDVVSALELPEDWSAQGLLLLGHPVAWPEPRERRPMPELIRWVDEPDV